VGETNAFPPRPPVKRRVRRTLRDRLRDHRRLAGGGTYVVVGVCLSIASSALFRALGVDRFGAMDISMCIAAAGGLVSAIIVYRRLKRPSPPPGCCRECGYDLTGNVSGICPECGTPIEKK
jgi:hypothetical protein